jgi:thiamine biosynthesis lipoprotein
VKPSVGSFVEQVESATPVLGTGLELRVGVDPADAGDLDSLSSLVLHRVLDEIDRLEPLLSVHDPASALRRWRAGPAGPAGPDHPDHAPPAELTAVLALAARWFEAGGGAFNPCAGRVVQLWRDSARSGVAPSSVDCSATAAAIAELPYTVVGGRVVRTGDTSGVDLNAIAKGYIVDRAVDAAWAVDPRVCRVVVNIGGDLRHRGRGSLRVGIEDPAQPHDNAEPLTVVEVCDAALATSGSARRGVEIGGRWYGHVFDPRTGRPVDDVTSVSVVAADAVTADVVATIVGVRGVVDGLAFVDMLDGVHTLVVDAAGVSHASPGWPAGFSAG